MKNFTKKLACILLAIFLSASVLSGCTNYDETEKYIMENRPEKGLKLSDYPDEVVDMLRKNPETEDFVLSYPLEKDKEHDIDLSQLTSSDTVPLLMQWDKRWGYEEYGDGIIALTGCGPTCLSMAAIFITKNIDFDPLYVAGILEKEGYYAEGYGTQWSAMSEGSALFGISGKELPLDKGTVLNYLGSNSPVICSMRQGDFTETGHFILLAGTKDGKLIINDPNSLANSEKLWEFEDISAQIRNLWAFEKLD